MFLVAPPSADVLARQRHTLGRIPSRLFALVKHLS
jgi:hypothetical protein